MTTTVFEIPLQATPQTIKIQLAGVTYSLTVLWNAIANAWNLNIADAANNPIVFGIPLVTGADLLEQFKYLNFGGKLVASTDNGDSPPNFTNLGTTGHLYFEVTS